MEMNAIILNSSEWIGVIAVILLLTLSRRFATRPVAFKYLRREIILSSILAVVLIAAAFYANLALKLPTLPDGEAHVGGQLLWTVAILLPVVLLLVIRRQPLLSVGLSRPSMTLGLMLGAALALITIFLRGKVYSLLDGVSAAEFNYLIISLVLALAGEIIFRGFIQLRFTAWLGRTGGWLVASLAHFLFCLPFVWLMNGEVLSGVWFPVVVQLVQSILLGWIMHRSGNVLASGLYQAASFWVASL
jgi:membrane protease YdiL (CAAX protease family)